MPYRAEVFSVQYVLVDDFVRHVVYSRALKAAIAEGPLRSPVWAASSDAHLFQATICWCMVFGSDRNNQTHWQNLAPDQLDDLLRTFREGLLADLQITMDEWTTYREHMLHFRDNYAGHRALEYNRPVPSFDQALRVAYFYDAWVRTVIAPDTLDERPLRVLTERLAAEQQVVVSRALGAVRAYEAGA